MKFVIGSGLYGAVEDVDGDPIVTEFFQLLFVPLLPISSYYGRGEGRSLLNKLPGVSLAVPEGLPRRLHGPSILHGYLRGIGGGGAALAAVFSLSLLGDHPIAPAGPLLGLLGAFLGLALVSYLVAPAASERDARIRRAGSRVLGLCADFATLRPAETQRWLNRLSDHLGRVGVQDWRAALERAAERGPESELIRYLLIARARLEQALPEGDPAGLDPLVDALLASAPELGPVALEPEPSAAPRPARSETSQSELGEEWREAAREERRELAREHADSAPFEDLAEALASDPESAGTLVERWLREEELDVFDLTYPYEEGPPEARAAAARELHERLRGRSAAELSERAVEALAELDPARWTELAIERFAQEETWEGCFDFLGYALYDERSPALLDAVVARVWRQPEPTGLSLDFALGSRKADYAADLAARLIATYPAAPTADQSEKVCMELLELDPARGLAWIAEQLAGADREPSDDDEGVEFKGVQGVFANHVQLEAVNKDACPAYLDFVRDEAVDPDLRAYALRGLCSFQQDQPEVQALLVELREGQGPLRETARAVSPGS